MYVCIYIRCIPCLSIITVRTKKSSKYSLKLLVMARCNLSSRLPRMYPNSNLLRKPYEVK